MKLNQVERIACLNTHFVYLNSGNMDCADKRFQTVGGYASLCG